MMMRGMRTTLDVSDDVLLAAKEIASTRGVSTGQVVSELLRKALRPTRSGRVRNGVPMLIRPAGSPSITMAAVNRLRDEP